MAVTKEILIPSILSSLRKFVYTTMIFFFPLFLSDKGLSGFEIGILFGIFSGAGLLFSFYSGLASDRHTIRNVSFIGFFLLAVFFFLLPNATNFFQMLSLFFIGGIAENLCEISLTSYVLKFTERHNRGQNVGFYTFSKIFTSSLGFFAGGFLILVFGFDISLKLGGIFAFIAGLGTLILKKNQTFYFPAIQYTKDFLKKQILIYAMILFLFTLHWGAEMTSYGLFLRDNLRLNTFHSGIYIAVPVLFLAVTSYVTGKKHDRGLSFKNIAYWGLFLAGLGHILMTYGNVYFSFAMRIVHEIGDGIFFIYLYGAIHKYFPRDRLGGNTGFIISVNILGTITGSLIFGPLGESFGYQWPLIISGIISLLILAIVKAHSEEI